MEEFTFEFTSDTAATLTGWTGEGGTVIVPRMADDTHTVTAIGSEAFYNKPTLEKLVLPDTIQTVGTWAFAKCSALTEVTLREGITEIGKNAFKDCVALKTLDLPDTVTWIGNYLVEGCTSLEAFHFPVSLESISVNMGQKAHVFKDCVSLKSVTVPEGVETLPTEMFYNAIYLEEVKLPTTLKTIGEGAFQYTTLKRIDLPEGLEEVGSGAFAFMENLTELNLPDTVRKIGNYLCEGCTNLTYFHYPVGLSDWNGVDILMG